MVASQITLLTACSGSVAEILPKLIIIITLFKEIPLAGFRIPKPWILDSTDLITWIPESRSRITLREATRIRAERFKHCFVDGCLLNLISFLFLNPWFDVLLHCTAVHKHHGRSLKSTFIFYLLLKF